MRVTGKRSRADSGGREHPDATHGTGAWAPRDPPVPAGRHLSTGAMRALEELLGRAGLADTLAMAIEDGAARVQRMHAGYAAGDLLVVTDAAHGLRGGAAHLGAEALCSACRDLERACVRPDTAALLDKLARVEQEFGAYRAAIAAHRESLLRPAPSV